MNSVVSDLNMVKRGKLSQALLFIFIFICILFPNDIFQLKKISFLLLIGLNFDLYASFHYKNIEVYLYGILFPAALLLHGIILGVPLLTVFSRVYCCLILLLLPIIQRYQIDFKSFFLQAVCVVMVVTLGIFAADMLGIVNVNGVFPLKTFILNNQIGIMGKEPSYALQYKIFIKTSPLIAFFMFDQLGKKHYVLAAIAYFSLLMSGTRANIAFCGVTLVLYFVFFLEIETRKDFYIKMFVIAVGITALILYGPKIIETIYTVMVTNGRESDSVRIGHFQGLIVQYKEKPWTILTGTGMGSSFYSFGTGAMESSIEIPYLDLIRQMGLILFSVFMYFVLKPLIILGKNRPVQLAYISYLLIAATNPLLFTSTAFLAYLYVYIHTSEIITNGEITYE